MAILPRYPVYIPSKGRSHASQTMQALIRHDVPFRVVVEPREHDAYAARFGADRLLVLPWDGDQAARREFCRNRGIENGGLIAVRNWIKEHATAEGHARHWQIDDNIQRFFRRFEGQRFPCRAGIALRVVEDLADRYENVAIAGLNYDMFAPEGLTSPPFVLNCRVYSCTLVDNACPYRWRLAYNDDTDICLQALADGACTILVNAFLQKKIWTCHVKGGNTDDLYQGDGRLKMARALERAWPGVVKTDRRFQRPQHVVRDGWKKFDNPLKLRKGIDLDSLPPVDEYGMKLVEVAPIRSEALRRLVAGHLAPASISS